MTGPSRSRLSALALGAVVLLGGGGWIGYDVLDHDAATQSARSSAESTSTCAVSTLPQEAQDTVELIHHGGPFPHPDNDGVRFGNYEGRLPEQSRNYYREYTVETPGVSHRGARRIVTGGDPASSPEHWYYTDDHYESFCEIPDADS
ncbi:ribonuclease [Corynebacterium uropygiale]|uniref:Ribonuclease n=1 Tax=Corynebacterium uropygiale TaxID=1775911 RepID=A0A9X1QQ83_9CORY|nr:ribonuclease domain-containing protein [Corynebacterium uropygiale]MCF4006205.1 ribonuclease [Corynebacterium uropygiale]